MEALLAANLPDATDRFAGQTITAAVIQGGPRGGISGPLFFWRDAFEKATGATLEIVELPIDQLLTTTATDFLTGQNTFDIVYVGSWFYGDYISNGWIIPIDDFIGREGFPEWDPSAIAPALDVLMTWEGQRYGVLNDGDAQLLYFRKDILDDPEWQAAFLEETGTELPNPPRTWQELLAVTSFFNGRDWNGDGDPDDGISLHLQQRNQGHFHYMSLSASFAQTFDPADPSRVTETRNVYWFNPVDMTPLINSPGHVAALEFLKELVATGPEAQIGWQLADAWDNFLSGNAIATFSWGDVGSLAQDPSRSTIQGKLGAAPIPCSDTWYDLELGEFVTDTENPNCIGNTVGGSWHGVISSRSDPLTQELAYYWLAMQATEPISFWNMAFGWTGVDPGASFHLFEPEGTATVEDFVNAGFDPNDAEQYITAYGDNLFDKPAFQTYLRIPGTPEYWDILDQRLAEAMIDQFTPQEALDLVAEEWEAVTDDLGREAQIEVYQAAIGFEG
ncbi:MAG: extracellular solute-binding protein [Chloroflexi bacterium]|nr:MAG: extracellular solute-binding protein [Chloroflexota bacterium]